MLSPEFVVSCRKYRDCFFSQCNHHHILPAKGGDYVRRQKSPISRCDKICPISPSKKDFSVWFPSSFVVVHNSGSFFPPQKMWRNVKLKASIYFFFRSIFLNFHWVKIVQHSRLSAVPTFEFWKMLKIKPAITAVREKILIYMLLYP